MGRGASGTRGGWRPGGKELAPGAGTQRATKVTSEELNNRTEASEKPPKGRQAPWVIFSGLRTEARPRRRLSGRAGAAGTHACSGCLCADWLCLPGGREVQTAGGGGASEAAPEPFGRIFQAEFGEKKIHLNCRFPGAERLPNTSNFSFRGPQLQGDKRLPLVSPWGGGCRRAGLRGPWPRDRGTEGPVAPRAESGGCPMQVARALALSLPESAGRDPERSGCASPAAA